MTRTAHCYNHSASTRARPCVMSFYAGSPFRSNDSSATYVNPAFRIPLPDA